MADIIQSAISKAKQTASTTVSLTVEQLASPVTNEITTGRATISDVKNLTSNLKGNLTNPQELIGSIQTAQNAISNAQQQLDKLKNLPISKNPEILKKQIEAIAQKKLIETKDQLMNNIEGEFEVKKQELIDLAKNEFFKRTKLPNIKLPPVPLGVRPFNPRILATTALFKLRNKVEQERQKISRENIGKVVEKFKYPLKPESPRSLKGFKIPEIPVKTLTELQQTAQNLQNTVGNIRNKATSLTSTFSNLTPGP